ncbi:hypothetical protein VTJ83DRAFT_50 [Remersonia thermophila]|uniref:Uncharacterized protein n=1 Tax=Remersonia thermophila TaxID=72144 RepID=A0ABR4DKX8_9PEZI
METNNQINLTNTKLSSLGESEGVEIAEEHLANDGWTPGSPISFFDWGTFDEFTLRPRKNIRRSRLNAFLSPLRSVNAGAGPISVEGLGGLIESAHNLFHSVRRLDFMESERTICLPSEGAPESASPPHPPTPGDLKRYENELFDLSKYFGSSCMYLTAATWTEESRAGSLTLYRVLLEEDFETGFSKAIAVRLVVAMLDVPSSVLAQMRADERIRQKTVLTRVEADDRTFDWRANAGRAPRYAWLADTEAEERTARLGESRKTRSRSRGLSPASEIWGGGRQLAEGNAVRATIPQFIALLHAQRSLLECARSTEVRNGYLGDGRSRQVVSLTSLPRSRPHIGNAVHVAVLAPEEAQWVDEETVWTDRAGLAELRQRAYWDVIERAVPKGLSGRSRSRMGRWGVRGSSFQN